jgi:glutamine synthetase
MIPFETSYDGSDPVEKFGGAQLVQGQMLQVSNGELNTFEAEDIPHGINISHLYMAPLYVFLLFISYTGEALDNKIPLLRALSAIDEAATDVCKYFDKM